MKFLSTVCLAAICTALFRLLIPENKFTKQMSLLITAVFVFTGISSVIGLKLETDTFEANEDFSENYDRVQQGFNEQIREAVCGNMRDRVEKLLNEREIFPKEIHVAVNIYGLYSIKFTQVELVFDPEEQDAADAAAELLSDVFPPDTVIKTDMKRNSFNKKEEGR